MTAMRNSGARSRRVRSSSEVLPEPGELMRLRASTPPGREIGAQTGGNAVIGFQYVAYHGNIHGTS